MRSVGNSYGLTSVSTACASVRVGLLCTSILPPNPPSPGNQVVDTLAEDTPGASATTRRTVSFAWMRCGQAGFAPLGTETFITKTWPGSNVPAAAAKAVKRAKYQKEFP